MTQSWQAFADRAIAGEALTREEAQSVLDCPEEELLTLLDAAYRVRQRAQLDDLPGPERVVLPPLPPAGQARWALESGRNPG